MTYPRAFCFCLLLIAAIASNVAAKTAALKPTVEPTLRDVKYGPHPRHKLHFWPARSGQVTPDQARPTDKPTPLVLFIHGGGWNGGTRIDKVLNPMLPELLENGISVASIEYRFLKHAVAEGLDPPVQAPMHDAARALQYVRSKASEWKIDPVRIGVSGGSAGACTSLWLAFHDDLADPDSDDPVARQSTRPYCAAVSRAQTTLDPQQMRAWIPKIRYGSRALGITKPGPNSYPQDFDAFLARRDEILEAINEYSPYALVTPDDRPVYLRYTLKPGEGRNNGNFVHSASFGVHLQKHMQQVGVDCELAYPGAPNVQHETIADYLIARLSAAGD